MLVEVVVAPLTDCVFVCLNSMLHEKKMYKMELHIFLLDVPLRNLNKLVSKLVSKNDDDTLFSIKQDIL